MKWTALPPDQLADARLGRARWVRVALAKLPKIEGPDYAASRAAFQSAVGKLAAHLLNTAPDAKMRDEWNGASVAMLGVRSTSTSGLHGALTNWCARVEKQHEARP